MKIKLIVAVLALTTSFLTFADESATSLRTPTGKIVSVGDSRQKLITSFDGQKPVDVRDYTIGEGHHQSQATNYTYEFNNAIYTIVIVNENVKSISWIRK